MTELLYFIALFILIESGKSIYTKNFGFRSKKKSPREHSCRHKKELLCIIECHFLSCFWSRKNKFFPGFLRRLRRKFFRKFFSQVWTCEIYLQVWTCEFFKFSKEIHTFSRQKAPTIKKILQILHRHDEQAAVVFLIKDFSQRCRIFWISTGSFTLIVATGASSTFSRNWRTWH